MQKTVCSALALALSCAVPAQAEEGDASAIVVEQQLLTPSAGLMHDHMHEGGEIMIGLRAERQRSSGSARQGTRALSDAAVLAAGYNTRAMSVEMDMVMLDLMYAPSSDLTLMVMPHYMWHRMEMVGIDPARAPMDMGGGIGTGMDGGHAGHGAGLAFGQVHAHGTEGFGDTLVSASYRLARGRSLAAHATLGLWLPTGRVDRRNADGTFVHYGMQSGSGTWDIEPVLTASGQRGALGWGGQAAYRWRTESANASGFAFGDRARASGWVSYLLARGLGATARLEYEHEGAIEGHYNGPHRHNTPSDIQANYGGDVVSAALGLNWRIPTGGAMGPQIGVEFAVPLHQDLNGIQLPRDSRLALSLAQTF